MVIIVKWMSILREKLEQKISIIPYSSLATKILKNVLIMLRSSIAIDIFPNT